MALYDTADCVRRCKDAAQLPDDDEVMSGGEAMDDAAWYRLLTAAQQQWYPEVAAHLPHLLLSAPRLLPSADGGRTYTFGTDPDGRPVLPYAVRVYRREDDAYDPFGDEIVSGADYTALGDRLEFRRGGARPSFPDGGPWVRYVAPPGVIDATHEPVLLPIEARELLVLSAVEAWAAQGDLRDSTPWRGAADRRWNGDPANPAKVGLCGALKLAYPAPAGGRGRRRLVARTYGGGG